MCCRASARFRMRIVAAVGIRDDLVAAGVEETFGTVVEAEGAGLYQAIAAATRWPVELDFRDVDGNVTVGGVSARVNR